jgi:hypothetical protein
MRCIQTGPSRSRRLRRPAVVACTAGDLMDQPAERFRVLTWADFDDFWRELEASHEETPYTFDAYDEEVARIAFKAGRESMRRQLVAMVEHMLETRRVTPSAPRPEREGDARQTATIEMGRALLRGLADDVSTLVRSEEN